MPGRPFGIGVEKVIEYVRATPGKEVTPKEVGDALNISNADASKYLNRAHEYGLIGKVRRGEFVAQPSIKCERIKRNSPASMYENKLHDDAVTAVKAVLENINPGASPERYRVLFHALLVLADIQREQGGK